MKNLVLILVTVMPVAFAFSAESRKDVAEKVARFFTHSQSPVGDGDTNVVSDKNLKGAAKAKYEKLKNGKECKSYGYCPEVYAETVYGTDVDVLAVSDDGGAYYYIYAKDGTHVTDCTQSESEDMTCGN